MPERNHPDNWMQTFSGRRFWALEPRAEDVAVEDVCHALSLLCRYGGHSSVFYSVAEHCVLVGQKVGIHGLLHDAGEAYLLDIPRPVKQLIPEYKVAELRVLEAIYVALEIPFPTEEEEAAVKEADNRMLATEKLVLHKPGHPWALPAPYPDTPILCWSPQQAEAEWRAAFNRFSEKPGAALDGLNHQEMPHPTP